MAGRGAGGYGIGVGEGRNGKLWYDREAKTIRSALGLDLGVFELHLYYKVSPKNVYTL